MPEDMVLPITYCSRRRESFVRRSLYTYEKRDEWESREKYINSFENSKGIDIFRVWLILINNI